jgi:hypothetical protein
MPTDPKAVATPPPAPAAAKAPAAPQATMVISDTGGAQCAKCGRFRSDGYNPPVRPGMTAVSFCVNQKECEPFAKAKKEREAAEEEARQSKTKRRGSR